MLTERVFISRPLMLLGDHNFAELAIIVAVHSVGEGAIREVELEQEWSPVLKKMHHVNRCRLLRLLEDEVIARDVPVADWLA